MTQKIPLVLIRILARVCGLCSVALCSWQHDFIGMALMIAVFLLIEGDR